MLAPTDMPWAELSFAAIVVYQRLLTRLGTLSNQVCASHAHLTRMAGIHRCTFPQVLSELERSGWVQVERLGRYRVRLTLCNPLLAARYAELKLVRHRLERARYLGEALMREWLNLLVDSNEYDDDARPGFLRNPATGENLEYDRWYTSGVAFEFNGPQHYRTTQAYPDPQQVDETRVRDLMKLGMSSENDVIQVVIRAEDLTYPRMLAAIADTNRLPIRKVRKDDPVLDHLSEASQTYIRRAADRSWRR